MANHTTYNSGEVIANRNGSNAAGYPATTVIVAEFDAADRNVPAGDTVDICDLPAGAIINNVVLEVVNTDAGGGTLAVGDTAGDSAYVAATALGSATKVKGAGAQIGELTTAATLGIRLTGATATVTTAKVRVYVDITVTG